jgi:hypothetical protein
MTGMATGRDRTGWAMWYRNSDQFVRAPTPSSFDRLVKDLEDNDSVMFQSIRLPRSTLASADPAYVPPRALDGTSLPEFGASDSSEAEEVGELKQQINDAIARNARKDEIIRERDERIAKLREQIAQRRKPAESEDPELIAFYKSQWETTQFQYDKLREVLATGDRPRAGERK